MIPFPRYLTIDVHDYCDAACAYCPYREIVADPNHDQGVMDSTLLLRLLDECAKQGPAVEAMRFGNIAESLIHPAVWPAMEAALSRGLPLYIDSNMTHLGETELDRLDAMGFAGKLFAHVQPDMGVDFEAAALNYNRAALRWGDRVEHVEILKPRKWPGDPTIPERRAVRCDANRPNQSMIIGWDGSVTLCCVDARRTQVVGNVSEASIAEVWAGAGFTRSRELLAAGENPLCNRCEWGTAA